MEAACSSMRNFIARLRLMRFLVSTVVMKAERRLGRSIFVFCGYIVKVSTDGGASVGDELREKGVSVRADSRSRMMSSLAVISRVLVVISKVWVVMVDRFRVRWYTTSSGRSRMAW